MPVPTEILNEDVKELRADIHRVDNRLSALAAEFGFAKWLLGLSLALTVSGISFGIWWGGNINAKVDGLEKRFDKIDSRFDRMETSFDALEKRFDKLDSRFGQLEFSINGFEKRFDKNDNRFDRLEDMVAKILEQTKPAAKP